MSHSVSLKEIARLAKVSTATVSRALYNMPGVSEAKRTEINEIVSKLGQQPKQRARRAAGQLPVSAQDPNKKGTICLLQTNDGYLAASELFVRQLKAMTEQAAQNGFDLVVAFGNQAKSLPRCIKERRVDGVIVYGGKASESVTDALQNIPTVWVASHSKIPRHMVLSGNEEAGQLAAEYLIRKGHENLVCFYLYEHLVMDARLNAFTTYVSSHGKNVVRLNSNLSIKKDPNKPYEWYNALCEPLIEQWMTLKPRPTGLFSPDDAITAYLYPLLKKRGIKMGEDLSIVSFGNESSFLAGLDPRPVSIDIGSEIVGQQAVEMLCSKIKQPDEQRGVSISIQPILIEP